MNELLSHQQVALMSLAHARTPGEQTASEHRVRHYSRLLQTLRRQMGVASY